MQFSEKPYQPDKFNFPKRSYEKKQPVKRAFQPSWFSRWMPPCATFVAGQSKRESYRPAARIKHVFCVLFSKLPFLFLPSPSATRHKQLYVRELYTCAFSTHDRCIIIPHATRALPALGAKKLFHASRSDSAASQPLRPGHSISASYALATGLCLVYLQPTNVYMLFDKNHHVEIIINEGGLY